MTSKKRLDVVLTELGLTDSRSKAQALILAGKVRVDGQRVDKAGTLVDPKAHEIELEEALPYVSRGGLKLAKALEAFNVRPQGRVCLDIGASTGGFTDCLLQNGAEKVYAVDVGYGQLDWRLRQDPRVMVLEKTNIRELPVSAIPEKASLAVIDVSFISLKKVLPAVTAFLEPESSELIALLKPQFEYLDYLDPKGFDGIVKGEAAHQTILNGVLADLATLMPAPWRFLGVIQSPITGAKGNIEFLLYFGVSDESLPQIYQD